MLKQLFAVAVILTITLFFAFSQRGNYADSYSGYTRLNNIYFDYNDDEILSDAEIDLWDLRDYMMENPSVKIELTAHTDSRGSASYNQSLSQRRADAAKNWLVGNGIAPSRIDAKGYGETRILNGCVDGVSCSSYQHEFNRRAEFKITYGGGTTDPTPTPNCSDGIRNGNETGVDCGGSDCPPCPTTPTCTDGIQNGNETGIDCGGSDCPPCPTTPTCTDGIQNGNETGIDCGGSDCPPCPTTPTCTDGVQNGNETGVDCGGTDCPPCPTTPTCTDGIQNGNETGIDCGGSDCPPCPTTPTCTDGVQNGNETGVDCGGPDCPPCAVVPPVPTCSDGIQNGNETGVDCGGPDCPACPVGPGGTPQVRIAINNTPADEDDFITWSMYPAVVSITNPADINADVDVTLRNRAGNIGKVLFSTASGTFPTADDISITLPADGSPVTVFIAGEFESPSSDLNDTSIDAVLDGTNTEVGTEDLMIRIRKNVNDLDADEIRRFITAFATLHVTNNQFQHFMDMHTAIGDPEAHSDAGFLPWHRALLADLERELQKIDPSVTIPYWKFDEPTSVLFQQNFMGQDNPGGNVLFAVDNPLRNWHYNGLVGIDREHSAITNGGSDFVISEIQTLSLGGASNLYGDFRASMEGNPHGSAHVSFSGWISNITTATRDPLFFLLHCNVDRLWAKWQWVHDRNNPDDVAAFNAQTNTSRIGHNKGDTMWPWNGVTTSPRPSTAPGGSLASSIIPSDIVLSIPSPFVGDMVDYNGKLDMTKKLGFSYDDVPTN